MAENLTTGAEATRLLAILGAGGNGRAIHLAATEGRAEAIARFLATAAPDLQVIALPPWDCQPYDWASPSPRAMGRRMAALAAMSGEGGRLVVTSPAAMAQRVVPPALVRARRLAVGDALHPERFDAWARGEGYRADSRVAEPGDICVRGAVIDIFPAAADAPVRIGIANEAIESIYLFDPTTQRTSAEIDAIDIAPATEMPQPNTESDMPAERGAEHRLPDLVDGLTSLAAHLPGASLLATGRALDATDAFLGALQAAHDERLAAEIDGGSARRPLPPDRLYLSDAEWRDLRDAATVLLDAGTVPAPSIAAARRPRSALADAIREADRTILIAATARDRARLVRMARHGAEVTEPASWEEALDAPDGAVPVLRAPLDHGFRDGGLLVLTARDVLGSRAGDAGGVTVVPPWLAEAQDLHAGDLVVHEDEGLGRYEGIETVGGAPAIRVAYAEDQACLVPVVDAGLLWRYGHDAGEVALDGMGNGSWAKRRAGFARSVAGTAKAMLARAADRADCEAPRLKPKPASFEKVVAGFGWEETRDQRAAIRAVLDDLASGRPMNRLLVGDVGFGKTEVAIRAAAAAVLGGAQVAVIAPTTVLARQHARTFAARLGAAGIEVASLSRLTPGAQAREIRAGLADGSVRVVVGTQALLREGTCFDGLGLVVIDEEQRFGRAQKRALREMAAGGHILSMTATPIPRSLQGAIVGLQEISLLTTAPARRRPVRTEVAERDDGLLREALAREWRRGGQSFVVLPRIEDIDAAADDLARLVPDLDIRIAHGKLPAREIDETMTGFADGRGDVLLATAIIESGLDVPRANTMVVLHPDLFGLAQLHQLRGRVGRGDRQAHCLLMAGPEAELGCGARARLEIFARMDALGAGFALSASDLDRRGAGDLFGDAQSGHEARIGPALHAEMLSRALGAAQGAPVPGRPEIHVDVEACLPENYIPDPDVRATLYVRLSRIRAPADADRLADEVEDRFGPPPPSAQALLRLAAIRGRAAALGLTEVSIGPDAIALEPASALERMSQDGEISGTRLLFPREAGTRDAPLDAALEVLSALE